MSENDSDLKDAFKQQFEEHWKWSQFYHDAEIKVNTAAIAISSLATISGKFLGPQKLAPIRAFGSEFNVVGIIVILASAAALISTLGYWRYYEMCDLYAKKFRERYIPTEILNEIKKKYQAEFRKHYPILRLVPEDAHHFVWIVLQVLFLLVGIRLLVAT